MVGIGGQRVGPPVADAVELDADPQVLAGPVPGPREVRPMTTVAASSVSGLIRSIVPVSSRADQAGFISPR